MLTLGLLGCVARPPLQGVSAVPGVPVTGRAYAIIPGESLLTILVFRGGLLASAGHNHVIASHALTGTIHVPATRLATTFEVHVPLASLTIDEPALRQALHRDDFPAEVPESARAGTRQNMLGAALLDAAHWPEIVLTSAGLKPASLTTPPSAEAGEVIASVEARVRGQEHLLTVPLRYQIQADTLTITGKLTLKQTQLGLTPFSAFMGALTVQDEMQVQIELRARAGAPQAR